MYRSACRIHTLRNYRVVLAIKLHSRLQMELGFFMSFARPCVHHAEAGQGWYGYRPTPWWGDARTSLQVAKMALGGAALTVDQRTLQLFAGCSCRLKALVMLPTVM